MTLIIGQIVDENDKPVKGASVYFISAPVNMPDIAQLTDHNGGFQISVPAKGQYVLGVRSEIHGKKTIKVDVTDESTKEIYITYSKK